MIKNIILLGLILASFAGYSQVPDEKIEATMDIPVIDSEAKEYDENYIYAVVEVMPEYPEGLEKLKEFISQNFDTSNLPENSKGRVFVQFVIEKDGSLSDIKVIRDLGFGTGREAVRVLKLAGKWKAGLHKGEPVRVRFTLPIRVR